ncbi:hypothetical protein AMTR_s00010p00212700 [Amborella trichopoda]|uniref:Large ribosomal subunit protein bL9c n=1 Tax=Amborella trichopoda TaxID=13333 RepID=W1NEQ4_AMBTC|nr:hypothetical protein AMTR_s00010p00212700 [Amborella trichopoda]
MRYIHCGRNLLNQLIRDQKVQNAGQEILPSFFVGQGVRYRKLEVILTTTIDKLGKAGETVKVAPGYFRNHLMPKLLAVPNIEKYAYLIREQRKLHQPEEVKVVKEVPRTEEDKMTEYQAAANRLAKGRLGLRRLIKVDNDLRVPVTKEELVAEVARQLCVSIQPENLQMPSDLTTLGEYEVPLRLPKIVELPELDRNLGVLV